jgi:predicted outer membrane repeat protein
MNSAFRGGALYNTGGPYDGIANINITSSTLTGNTATDNGGAIFNTDDTGNATVM